MEPLNKQERTEAFLKVLVLFLLAVILVAIPMYYAFKMPSKETSVNNAEFDNLKKELADSKLYDKQFLMKTDSALAIYKQFEQEKDNFARDRMQLRYSSITNGMEDFAKSIRSDSLKPMLYTNVVFSFNKLFSNKNEFLTLQDQVEKAKSEAGGGESGEKKEPTLLSQQIEILKKALANNAGNRRNAARELGMTEKLLSSILKEYKF